MAISSSGEIDKETSTFQLTTSDQQISVMPQFVTSNAKSDSASAMVEENNGSQQEFSLFANKGETALEKYHHLKILLCMKNIVQLMDDLFNEIVEKGK